MPPNIRHTLGIVRRTVGHCHNQYSFFRQQLTSRPHTSLRCSRCSITCQRVMTSKLSGANSFSADSGFTSRLKCAFANSRACGLFSTASTFHPRRAMVSAKYPVPVPISSKTPSFTVCFSCYQTRFATQHIGTYIMVDIIHRALARISVRNIVRSLIVLAYLCFHGDSLCECKSTVLTRIQFKLFARSIKNPYKS